MAFDDPILHLRFELEQLSDAELRRGRWSPEVLWTPTGLLIGDVLEAREREAIRVAVERSPLPKGA